MVCFFVFISPTFIHWNSTARKGCRFSSIHIFSWLFPSGWTHGDLFYSVHYNPTLAVGCVVSLTVVWPRAALLVAAFVFCHQDRKICVCIYLALPSFMAPQMFFSWTHLVFSLFRPWIQPLLQAAPIPAFGEGFRNRDPGSLLPGSHCFQTFLVDRARKCMCVHQHTHPHVCISLSVCIFKTMTLYGSPGLQVNSTEFILSSPFRVFNFLLQEGGIGYSLSGTYLFTWSVLAST